MCKHCQNPLCKNKPAEDVLVSTKNCTGKSNRFVIEPPPKEIVGKPLFRIVYTIDVDADSPRKAAEYAYKLMTDAESMPPVLYVIDADGSTVRVDLSEDPDEADYCAVAEYLAEQGLKIFTGPMNGGLWNARCMDASILSKKKGDKEAYQLLINYGDKLSSVLPLDVQDKWIALKDEVTAMLKQIDNNKGKLFERDNYG